MKRAVKARVAAAAAVLCLTAVAVPAWAQGLAPPPPMGPWVPPAQTQEELRRRETEEQLRRAEQEDSGRSLTLVYVSAGVGAGFVDGGLLSKSSPVLKDFGGFGPTLDLGAGVNLLAFSVGARGRFFTLPAFNLATVGAEAAFHWPTGSLVPYAGLQGGYAFSLGGVKDDALAAPFKGADVSVRGATVGAHGGADYYLGTAFSLGLDLGADVLFLGHDGVPSPTVPLAVAPDGSGTGMAFTGVLRAGLHL